jgi:hypothetical protein
MISDAVKKAILAREHEEILALRADCTKIRSHEDKVAWLRRAGRLLRSKELKELQAKIKA